MKNRGIVYIFISIILIVIACFFVYSKHNSMDIDSNILNRKWYHYDNITGYYDVFYIENNVLQLDFANNKYNSCNEYTYNSSNNELKLDCGKKIIINNIDEDKLILNIDSKKVVFFDNVDNSLNYEFKSFYNKSMVEYKKDKKVVSDYIKIDYKRFYELFSEKEFSYFVFFDNNCSSVDCVLSLNVVEKWISKNNNVYYVNINDFSDDQMRSINNLNKNFSMDRNYYNNIYPRVLIVNDKVIYKDFEFICEGFDCTSYENIF